MNELTIGPGDESLTIRLGRALAASLPPRTVIALIGPLGAGKTRLVQAVGDAAGVASGNVASPTFVLIHEYSGRVPIFHFDVYRLRDEDEFLALGPEEYFTRPGWAFIEWADRVEHCLPPERLEIDIEPVDRVQRKFKLRAVGQTCQAALAAVAKSVAANPCLSSIALIGYRGCGKTKVAPLVAEKLGWSCIDADDEIERRAGKTIAAIFADEGEAAFRDLESAVLGELILLEQAVLALGGGVVLRAENRATLCTMHRAVVWLQAAPETLHRRITGDDATKARRPNLTGAGGMAEIRLLLSQREPWYQECANLIVDTEDKSPGEVASEIVDWVRLDRETK
ncbi:MAG: tRNA (adenosine(37)-N6)-threonylcarbamoyltransferase complex ATPase subunit type 1 TsaE [Pirellulales bacterium]|nr:tRNA (adenosine(37)-N6)-threonylcarbamoyltransferase complex ATPase subunit type 1 TsaE [Pirellulales bacterium]